MEPLLPTPPSFRNLTGPLAAWLRKMGFTVLEKGPAEAPSYLSATWCDFDETVFEVGYTFVPEAGGLFRLLVHYPQGAQPRYPLVDQAQVRRLSEARFLLLSNVYYAQRRQQSKEAGALPPTHRQPLPSQP